MTRTQFIQRAVLAQLGPQTRDSLVVMTIDCKPVRKNDAFCADAVHVASAFADALEAEGIEFPQVDSLQEVANEIDHVAHELADLWQLFSEQGGS